MKRGGEERSREERSREERSGGGEFQNNPVCLSFNSHRRLQIL